MPYFQLPYRKVKKDNETINLTNFPRNHVVSVLLPNSRYLDDINNIEFQHSIIGTIKNKLLAN